MTLRVKLLPLLLSTACCVAGGTPSRSQETQPIRQGLTAQQTKQATEVARGTLVELRKRDENAQKPEVDTREYIVAVEMIPARKSPDQTKNDAETKTPAEAEKNDQPEPRGNEAGKGQTGTLALVTSYRYFDDTTIFATIDLSTGNVVSLETARHVRTALSNEEFEDAKLLAKQNSEPVKELFEKFGDHLTAYPQFSQYAEKDDPTIHRVVHLTYRVGKKDLSYPRPVIDLTTRSVETPGPEVFPQPRPPR